MEKNRIDLVNDVIIRTNRKTISLQITDSGKLVIKAPSHVSEETILKIISKKEDWIKKIKEEIKLRDPKFSPKEFVNGEGFLFLGKNFKLEIVDNQNEPIKFENKFYLSRKFLPQAKEVFIDWYKKVAYEKILDRVKFYSLRSGLYYNRVNITDAQKRWGSCSKNGNLNFSWRLIMAPLPVIDYVVVHELAHLEIKNHSKTFWNKVKVLMPNYEIQKDWLERNGHLLKL